MLACATCRVARSLLSSLEWHESATSGVTEARVPAGIEPFAVAAALRDGDGGEAAYSCERRGEVWFVLCLLTESEEPRPAVYRTELRLSCSRVNYYSKPVRVYGPNPEAVRLAIEGLRHVMPGQVWAHIGAITAVDYGDGEPGAYEYDGENEAAVAAEFRDILTLLRRVYPVDIPDNFTVAQRIRDAFANL